MCSGTCNDTCDGTQSVATRGTAVKGGRSTLFAASSLRNLSKQRSKQVDTDLDDAQVLSWRSVPENSTIAVATVTKLMQTPTHFQEENFESRHGRRHNTIAQRKLYSLQCRA